jgi:iron complex outermembrane recepter protein
MPSNWGGVLLSASTMALVGTWCTPGLTDEAATPQGQAQSQQAESRGLEEIVVSVQRRSKDLQNVRVAVTAFSADPFTKTGVDNVRLLATAVPGLTYTTVADIGLPRIRGSGIGVAFAGARDENAVATSVDDVYYASVPSVVLSFNNISRIAVLKEPVGDALRAKRHRRPIQITKRDHSQPFNGLADVAVGNHNTYGANFYVTFETQGAANDPD